MNEIAEQIHTEITKLLKERQRLERVMHDLRKQESRTKSDMHKLEVDVFRDSMSKNSQSKSKIVAVEVIGIKHDHKEIKDDEKSLHQLAAQIKALNNTIGTHEFWMKRSNVDNPTRQAEAHKHIFGR
jgi:chromosome segregation ATPase